MKQLVENFTTQLKEAMTIASRAILTPAQQIDNVLVSGLGGSGIGGTIMAEIVDGECPVPVLVNKDYFLPGWVSKNTLVIICSYSGNTEETINVTNEALAKGCKMVAITSGGKILDIARQHQLDFIEIPGGMPPRSCIGYSLIQLMRIFVFHKLATEQMFRDVEASIELLDREKASIQKEAMDVAKKIADKFPMLYSLGTCEGTVVRFRQQLNENGKILCGHHTFPEMNHNELVGWTTRHDYLAVVTFHTSMDYERTKKRYEFCKPVFEKFASHVIDINAKGKSKVEQFMYLINIGDWISCYVADVRGIDPVEVKVIDQLKGTLAKV